MTSPVTSSERLPFTLAYVASLVFTLYASLIARSYLLVVFSTGLQIGKEVALTAGITSV